MTTVNEPLVDARDMFAVHTMFRREFGKMPGLALEEDRLPAIFEMIMYEADPAVIDAIVAEMPTEIQPVIKDVAVLAYAVYALQLYGTAAPARVTGSPQR